MELLSNPALLLDAQVVLHAGVLSYLWSALIAAVVLILCAFVLPGVHIDGFVSALILGVIVGAIVGLVGRFFDGFGWIGGLVVTTLALIAGDALMDSVKLDAWWWAVIVAVIVSITSGLPGLF